MKGYTRAFAVFIGLSCITVSRAQSPSAEYQVKAAFLFNFAQFVQWPAETFADRNAPFTMCLAGDPFEGALERTIAGETLNGHRITIRTLAAGEGVRGCQLVYVSAAESRRQADLIQAAGNMPILTVGDAEDFIDNGGMIRFTKMAYRVRFEINPNAAERASLHVSSRLLRLADIAKPRQRAGTR